jgi:hypothetical protein
MLGNTKTVKSLNINGCEHKTDSNSEPKDLTMNYVARDSVQFYSTINNGIIVIPTIKGEQHNVYTIQNLVQYLIKQKYQTHATVLQTFK